MAWHFWLILVGSLLAFYGLPRLIKAIYMPANEREEVKPVHIRLFGGPKHGSVHRVPADDKPQFFIAPYLPTDEDGQPNPENMIGQIKNTAYFEPSYAYYISVTDDSYFYARDVTQQEIEVMNLTGQPIPARPLEADNHDE